MTDYKLEFAKLLEKAILKDEFDSFRIIALIERPPEKEMGDFSFPTFTLSKTFKVSKTVLEGAIKSVAKKPIARSIYFPFLYSGKI